MKRSSLLILVIAALVCAIAVASLYLSMSTPLFKVHGVVDVGGNTGEGDVFAKIVNVRVEIKTPSDTVFFKNITTVSVPEDTAYVLFKPVSSNVSGKMHLMLNGKVVLVSVNDAKKYIIDMPCILSVNETCYRVQMIIPGYDRPLRVEPGTYNVTLILSWRASGRGEFDLSIGLVMLSGEEAVIMPTSTKPVDTTNWIYAKNSTRSYALLVDKDKVVANESGCGAIRAWAWMFTPSSGKDAVVFTFKIIDTSTSVLVAEARIPVEKQGMYYQVLVMIKLKPGKYILVTEFPNGVQLEIPIDVLSQQ